MADTSIAPEPLNKLVWRSGSVLPYLVTSVVVEDLNGENTEYYQSQPSSTPNPFTVGENVNLVERYLLEVLFLIKFDFII
jgi:hypothetical protein